MNQRKTDIRQIVQARLKSLRWSNYKLAEACRGQIPVSTVYEFLAGKGNLNSEQLGPLLDVIGMGIIPGTHPDEDHAQGLTALFPPPSHKKRK